MRYLAVVVLLLAGCATDPDEISTAYVSPMKYGNYDCEQLAMEMDHISQRTTELYFALKKKSNDDAAQMGAGMIILWPMLFFLEGGDGPEAVEYSRMRGENEALRKEAINKKCAASDLPAPPDELIKARLEEEKKREPINNGIESQRD